MLGRLVAILVGVDYNIDKDHAEKWRQNIVLEMKRRQECARLLLAKVTI